MSLIKINNLASAEENLSIKYKMAGPQCFGGSTVLCSLTYTHTGVQILLYSSSVWVGSCEPVSRESILNFLQRKQKPVFSGYQVLLTKNRRPVSTLMTVCQHYNRFGCRWCHYSATSLCECSMVCGNRDYVG